MSKKFKILFFGIKTFPSRGGTDRVAENLIRYLKEDFDITLFCYRESNELDSFKDIKVIRFNPLLKGSPGALIYFIRSVFYALWMKFDLIHVHKTECSIFIPLLRIRHKVIATSHEAPYLRDKWGPAERFYFKVAEWFFVRTTPKITCISEPLTRYYESQYGREVIYIPNGIDPAPVKQFDQLHLHSLLPSGASIHKPFILFAARRLMSTKGCHTLLKALHKIRFTGQIFIAGESTHHTGYLHSLHKLAEGLDVHFIGFIHPLETMLGLLLKSQFFVFPSEIEGMSIMLLEAASSGVPVIASDIPENRILNGNEILFFKNGSADDLAEKISFALEQPQLMSEMGQRAKQSVTEKYSWKPIADQYKKLYLDLLQNLKALSQENTSGDQHQSSLQWIIKQS